MKKLYVTETTRSGDEFVLLVTENKEEAIKEARSTWGGWTKGDRNNNRLEIREYIEDIEAEGCDCYDYNTVAWQIWTASRETGDLIEQCDSITQAEVRIDEYEETDKADETYEPNFYEIVNEEHERITKTTEAQKRASAKYDKEHTKAYAFKLNKETDKDIIEALDRSPNKQALFKMAMRDFLRK